jgi:hypothetical protein
MAGVITERARKRCRYVIDFKVGQGFGEGQARFLLFATEFFQSATINWCATDTD